jgi:hypothetical protein
MGHNHDEFFQPEEKDGGTLGIIKGLKEAGKRAGQNIQSKTGLIQPKGSVQLERTNSESNADEHHGSADPGPLPLGRHPSIITREHRLVESTRWSTGRIRPQPALRVTHKSPLSIRK